MLQPVDPAIRAQFHPEPGLTYLDTATYGLPPDRAVEALKRAEEEWIGGTGVWVEWDRQSDRARQAFARLMNTKPARVALLPAASAGVGVVAASLNPGDRVVTARAEFRSVLYPLLVARDRGIDLHEIDDVDHLVDAIVPGTKLVALSLVQMQTGRVLPIREIVDNAEQVGARVLLDGTHGIPFVSLDDVIDRLDYLVAAAYKHLLCPRGVAFMVLRDDHVGRCRRSCPRGAHRTTRTGRSSAARCPSRKAPRSTTPHCRGTRGSLPRRRLSSSSSGWPPACSRSPSPSRASSRTAWGSRGAARPSSAHRSTTPTASAQP